MISNRERSILGSLYSSQTTYRSLEDCQTWTRNVLTYTHLVHISRSLGQFQCHYIKKSKNVGGPPFIKMISFVLMKCSVYDIGFVNAAYTLQAYITVSSIVRWWITEDRCYYHVKQMRSVTFQLDQSSVKASLTAYSIHILQNTQRSKMSL